MKQIKLTKDEGKKLLVSVIGFVFLLYAYFTFFLGPLNKKLAGVRAEIASTQSKLEKSRSEISDAAKLEKQAHDATERFANLKALCPEGAPIAWFPPRIRTFFAGQQIDKATVRLDGSAECKEAELSGWAKYNWQIELPQVDYVLLGHAVAHLENTEPLLSITRFAIQASPDQAQFQKVNLAVLAIINDRK
jgi:hypothetical protein